MSSVVYDNPVGDLQERIKDGLTQSSDQAFSKTRAFYKRPNSRKLSRAAYLHLIDQLAKVGPTGIIVILLVTAWISITCFAVNPAATLVWASCVALSGGKLLIRNHSFLAGDAKIASRPFHWRSCHTANLSVFGTAFGAGMIMLIPETGAPNSGGVLGALIICSTLFATGTQLAHGRAALSLILPVLLFTGWAAFRLSIPATVLTIGSAVLIVVMTMLAMASILILRQAERRYPRTVHDTVRHNVSRLPFRRKVLPSVASAAAQRAVG